MRQRPFSTMTHGDAVRNGSTSLRSRIGARDITPERLAAVVADRTADEEVERHRAPSSSPCSRGTVRPSCSTTHEDVTPLSSKVPSSPSVEHRLWPGAARPRSGRRRAVTSAAAICAPARRASRSRRGTRRRPRRTTGQRGVGARPLAAAAARDDRRPLLPDHRSEVPQIPAPHVERLACRERRRHRRARVSFMISAPAPMTHSGAIVMPSRKRRVDADEARLADRRRCRRPRRATR